MWYSHKALLLNIFVNIPPEVREIIHIYVGGKLKVFFLAVTKINTLEHLR